MQAKAEAAHGVQRQQRRHEAELSSARTTQRRTARRQSGNSEKNVSPDFVPDTYSHFYTTEMTIPIQGGDRLLNK